MKVCDICKAKYSVKKFDRFRLRIGITLNFQIGVDYIEPIDLNVCDWCKKGRKQDVINKFKNLLPSE
ncbi:MAG: hypothetical protein HWN80_18605 [Candidatus Lokiarchaeota archaeon]|nr:hypothetical protein [Candidatus Lokiarchaeota archaeon]